MHFSYVASMLVDKCNHVKIVSSLPQTAMREYYVVDYHVLPRRTKDFLCVSDKEGLIS